MKVFKKVTKSGSITIPQQIRHETGIKAGVPLEIESTENGLMLKKYTPTCLICGSAEDVVEVEGYYICTSCAEKVLERIRDEHRRD